MSHEHVSEFIPSAAEVVWLMLGRLPSQFAYLGSGEWVALIRGSITRDLARATGAETIRIDEQTWRALEHPAHILMGDVCGTIYWTSYDSLDQAERAWADSLSRAKIFDERD